MRLTCFSCHYLFEVDPAQCPEGVVYCPQCYAANPLTQAYLTMTLEDGTVKQYRLGPNNTVGRHPNNTIQILDRMISKDHARIFLDNGHYKVLDLQSRNGTFVNDQQIADASLSDGAEVRFGTVALRFYQQPLDTSDATHFGQSDPMSTMAESGFYFREREDSGRRQVTIIADMNELQSSISKISRDVNKDFLPEKEITDAEQLRKDYEKLRIAHLLNRKIGMELQLDKLLDLILEETFSVVPADRGVIFLFNAQGEAIPKCVKGRGARENNIEDGDFSISSTLLNTVVRERAGVISSDAKLDERFARAESIILQGIRSAMCVPFISRSSNTILGVMHLDTQSAVGVFTEKDLQIVSVVSSQAAIAIENAQLTRKIEEETIIRAHLQRFLSPAVMDRLNKDHLTIRMGGELADTTIMFTDIRGFTSMSERLDAEDLVADLNEYFELLVDIIFAHEGTLDKFIGDAIMAVWGTPQSHPEDPRRAVLAAHEIQMKLKEFNEQRQAKGRPPLLTGIGINSGHVVAGNMGSQKRLEFTVIGDNVNIASRLCSQAAGGEVIISQSTYEAVREHFLCDELPAAEVKGKSEALQIYRVEGVRIPGT
ncbi:MAG: FHA domain-containing protein [Myxococcales bacterium]|nr:FHA domain-containing protein [Myxococcales bacterium]MCB9644109.1 FHA domain-containing protein [Myxococcales bacterium]